MKDLDFFTRDDWFANGFNEDGGEIIKSNIYIVCEDIDGRCFALNDSDLNNISLSLEEINDIQERRIKKIKEHIAKGGRLDLNNWHEIDPAYGSKAYQELDKTGYFAEMERQREEEANYMRANKKKALGSTFFVVIKNRIVYNNCIENKRIIL